MIRGSLSALLKLHRGSLTSASPSGPRRTFQTGKFDDSNVNPVAVQMIDYATSLARSMKSDESYAEGMLVLEQCLSSSSSMDESGVVSVDNSKGMVLLAMSDLLFARGKYGDAMDKLQRIRQLTNASMGVRVAAMEALVGINLQLGDDDTASVVADKCLELWENHHDMSGLEEVHVRAKTLKGYVELARGNAKSAMCYFEQMKADDVNFGASALAYGEILHVSSHLSEAKIIYQNVMEETSKVKELRSINSLSACNMERRETLLAATCALGQLETLLGDFDVAESTLTKALNEAEQTYGCRHPKIGVVLACLALMFRQKDRAGHPSSLLIQEGLYRRAAELLNIPPLDSHDAMICSMKDIAAIVRGGYADVLGIQRNREAEAEKMKTWAECAWTNSATSLTGVLNGGDTLSKAPVIDSRICRVL